MSENKYLTGEETEYIRHHSVRFKWTTESDTKRLIDDISARDRELARMRKALEDAPHDRNCNGAFGRGPLYPCDCWKSRALNPQPAQEEKA